MSMWLISSCDVAYRLWGNVVRYGITMYGLNPSGAELKLPDTFKPALSLESELVCGQAVATRRWSRIWEDLYCL